MKKLYGTLWKVKFQRPLFQWTFEESYETLRHQNSFKALYWRVKMEDFAESLEFEIFVVDKDVWWEVVEVGASLRRNF